MTVPGKFTKLTFPNYKYIDRAVNANSYVAAGFLKASCLN